MANQHLSKENLEAQVERMRTASIPEPKTTEDAYLTDLYIAVQAMPDTMTGAQVGRIMRALYAAYQLGAVRRAQRPLTP